VRVGVPGDPRFLETLMAGTTKSTLLDLLGSVAENLHDE